MLFIVFFYMVRQNLWLNQLYYGSVFIDIFFSFKILQYVKLYTLSRVLYVKSEKSLYSLCIVSISQERTSQILKYPPQSLHMCFTYESSRVSPKRRSAPFLTFRLIERERNGPRTGVERQGLSKLLLWPYNVTSALPFDLQSELLSSRWSSGVVSAWIETASQCRGT